MGGVHDLLALTSVVAIMSSAVKEMANQDRPSTKGGSSFARVSIDRGQPITEKTNSTHALLTLFFGSFNHFIYTISLRA